MIDLQQTEVLATPNLSMLSSGIFSKTTLTNDTCISAMVTVELSHTTNTAFRHIVLNSHTA